MTTPPAPPAPAVQGQPPAPPPEPAPPAPGQPPAGQNGTPPAGPNGTPQPEDVAALRDTLSTERARIRNLEQELSKLRQQSMTEDERKLAEARAEGKAEAEAAAARLLAAAELRHLLTGRVADPEGTVEGIDLDKFVKDGQPNRRAITAYVDKLAAAQQQQQPPFPGRVPAGVRQPPPEDDPMRAWMRG